MNTYIALLRGINVGGKNMVPTKTLQRAFAEIGSRNVETYIQSGNVVFRHAGTSAEAIAERIGAALERSGGFRPETLVLTERALGDAIASNPFPEATSEPNKLHLTFLSGRPSRPDLESLGRIAAESERFLLLGRVFYLHAPDGIGRSKLAARIEKALGVSGTSRNWRTVARLKSMAEGLA